MINSLSKYFSRDQFSSFAKSFITINTVSFLSGSAAFLIERSFWAYYILSFVLQIIIGYVIATYTYSHYKSTAYMAELEVLEKLSTLLNCAYCNQPNVITFLPDNIPDLKCDQCGSISSVKLHFTVARTTTAISNKVSLTLKEPQTTHNIKL